MRRGGPLVTSRVVECRLEPLWPRLLASRLHVKPPLLVSVRISGGRKRAYCQAQPVYR